MRPPRPARRLRRGLPLASLVLGAALAAACGDDLHPSLRVGAGRLAAVLDPVPARIHVLLDDAEVWATTAGAAAGGGPPLGFAGLTDAVATVDSFFGAFRFVDPTPPRWRGIDQLGDLAATADGATFSLWAGGARVGDGALTFVPAPDGGDLPARVRLRLTTPGATRLSLAAGLEDDEHLVGLGGQSFDVDHRGQTVPLWVQEDGIGKYPDPDDQYPGVWFLTGRKHSTHTPMPMVTSSRGYAVGVETLRRAVFALGSEDAGVARFEAWEPMLDLQLFVGAGGEAGQPRDPGAAVREAVGRLVGWAGKAPRPPRFAFAPWVDAIFGSANVRRVAARLRSAGVPASVIWSEDWRGGVDTDLGYALEENWRVQRGLYPDIEQLADDLHGAGYKFLVYFNTFLDQTADVYGEAVAGGYTLHDAAGGPYTFDGVKLRPSTMLDLSNPAARTWAHGVLGEAVAGGADGWMADFGEWLQPDAVLASGEDPRAVHNRYPQDWARLSRGVLDEATARDGVERLHFMRSGWLHAQPDVGILWAGDQQTDFSEGDGLPSVIPMGLGLGVTGFPYFTHDIAGYMSQGTTPTSEELFYRWTSFGALSPVMRTHHGRSAKQNFQWEHDDASVAHFRRWARLHMQLVPYLWGAGGGYEATGLPLFRLIALHWPDATWAWTRRDEYLLGDRLLVAPVVTAGQERREVALPPGDWFPLLGGPRIAAGDDPDGRVVTVDAPRTELPAFVPAGTLLVLYPDGVDTLVEAPATPAARTGAEVGADREAWLWPGAGPAAAGLSVGTWDDERGPVPGAASVPAAWRWQGRPVDAGAPAGATWNGAPVALAAAPGAVTVTVTGDGTLAFDGGGALTIARGAPAARVTVRLATP